MLTTVRNADDDGIFAFEGRVIYFGGDYTGTKSVLFDWNRVCNAQPWTALGGNSYERLLGYGSVSIKVTSCSIRIRQYGGQLYMSPSPFRTRSACVLAIKSASSLTVFSSRVYSVLLCCLEL